MAVLIIHPLHATTIFILSSHFQDRVQRPYPVHFSPELEIVRQSRQGCQTVTASSLLCIKTNISACTAFNIRNNHTNRHAAPCRAVQRRKVKQ